MARGDDMPRNGRRIHAPATGQRERDHRPKQSRPGQPHDPAGIPAAALQIRPCHRRPGERQRCACPAAKAAPGGATAPETPAIKSPACARPPSRHPNTGTMRRPIRADARPARTAQAVVRAKCQLQLHPPASRGRQNASPHAGQTYQWPLFSMETQGSAGACAAPACNSSIDTLSGERTKAMRPSRGGRLIVTPLSIRCWHIA